MRKHLLGLFDQQLYQLSEHPFYSEESFEDFSVYERFKNSERQRIGAAITLVKNGNPGTVRY
jgi:hypothetical protein